MTATEQLRKLLDERSVEWACHGYENHTWWNGSGVFGWHAENRPSVNGLFVKLEAVCTPEQAIAATLESDREAELEELVRDWQELYENPDYGECVRLTDRTRKLGIEVEQ